MTAESRRMLGVSLLAGSAGIALLMLAWLMTSGVQAGGAVLGLLLLFVLAGPLAAGGYYVLVQGRAEHVKEQQFAGKRRILDADRLFRRELAARLRQLANWQRRACPPNGSRAWRRSWKTPRRTSLPGTTPFNSTTRRARSFASTTTWSGSACAGWAITLASRPPR